MMNVTQSLIAEIKDLAVFLYEKYFLWLWYEATIQQVILTIFLFCCLFKFLENASRVLNDFTVLLKSFLENFPKNIKEYYNKYFGQFPTIKKD